MYGSGPVGFELGEEDERGLHVVGKKTEGTVVSGACCNGGAPGLLRKIAGELVSPRFCCTKTKTNRVYECVKLSRMKRGECGMLG